MNDVPLRVIVAWIVGLAMVGGGIALKRVVAPALADPHHQAWTAIVGILCATSGLGSIAVGISIRNRVARERAAQNAPQRLEA
jgi:hypothetical protein